ncbi:mCG1027157, partial [Mus musculus]
SPHQPCSRESPLSKSLILKQHLLKKTKSRSFEVCRQVASTILELPANGIESVGLRVC